jgi:hypothetical protein
MKMNFCWALTLFGHELALTLSAPPNFLRLLLFLPFSAENNGGYLTIATKRKNTAQRVSNLLFSKFAALFFNSSRRRRTAGIKKKCFQRHCSMYL